jgi:hypothetical protein
LKKRLIVAIIIISSALIYAYYPSKQSEVSVKNDHSTHLDTVEKSIVNPPEVNEFDVDKNNLSQSVQENKNIQNEDHQPQVPLSSSTEISPSPKNANIEAQDSLVLEYTSNSECEVYFHYKSDDEIDSLLIDLGNVGTLETQQDLEAMESSLKNRMADCKQRIGSQTYLDFIKSNEKILRSSADAGNSISQLRLAVLLQQQSANKAELTPAEKSELYSEHIQWLTRASDKGNAEAKVFLALAYLDPVNYPEEFNLEEASRLVDEAGSLLGKDLKHLKDMINSF